MRLVPCFSLLILGLALITGGAAASSAQGLPGGATSLNETHGDWTVACAAPKGTVRCAISQTQINNESRQRVLTIELQATEKGKTASGILVMPFGLRLGDGVTLAIDENQPLSKARFSTCLPAGCVVPLAFDAKAVTAMRTGTALRLKAAGNDTGRDVAFSISLTGFAAALARAAGLNGA